MTYPDSTTGRPITRSRGTNSNSGPSLQPKASAVIPKTSKRKQHLARTTHPPPAKKKATKKSTASTKDLPPRRNNPPGKPRRFPLRTGPSLVAAAAPPVASAASPGSSVASAASPVAAPTGPSRLVAATAPPVASASSPGSSFASAASRVASDFPPVARAASRVSAGAHHSDLLAGSQGQKLSDAEMLLYADAVAHRKSIGRIYTHPTKGAILEPVMADSKPTGESLNDAEAWTAFGLADGTDLFGDESRMILHDTGNKTENDRAKVLSFRRFILSIRDHAQLSKLADLVPDPEGGMVVRFYLVIRGLSTNVKMQALNILMLCWSYEFHAKGKDRKDPNATYQPNYTDKVVRQIFKCCKFSRLIVTFH
jgi:hypothetical protein